MRGSIWPFQFALPRDIQQAEVKTTKDQAIQKRTEPAFIEPMHCKPVAELPVGEKWSFEIKFDGYRCVVVKRARDVTANEETFTSQLIHCHGELGEQQATFSNSELSPEERHQIEVGATFVWTIGYRHIGATRHRDSMIYFRRLPPWSVDELDVAKWKAEKLGRAISWE